MCRPFREEHQLDDAPESASDIAARVSTYREQVTREISLLAKEGVVAKNAGALVVLDVRLLDRMVKEVR